MHYGGSGRTDTSYHYLFMVYSIACKMSSKLVYKLDAKSDFTQIDIDGSCSLEFSSDTNFSLFLEQS